MDNFITAQILGIFIIIACGIMPQMKTKARMIFCGLIADVLMGMQFFLLGAQTGIATSAASVLRRIVLHAGVVALAWQSWTSGFLLFSLANIYGQWQENLKVTRLCDITTSIGFFTYSLLSRAYIGAANEIIIICSATLALWRFRNRDNKGGKANA